MRLLLAAFVAALPIPHAALLKIDRAAGYRNFLPTRLPPGFTYAAWSKPGATLHVKFRNKAGVVVDWRVEGMKGTCDAGKQLSFQVGGNKVWWAHKPGEQVAWRCVFDQAGKPVRLVAATTAPTKKLSPVGLAITAAHAKRY